VTPEPPCFLWLEPPTEVVPEPPLDDEPLDPELPLEDCVGTGSTGVTGVVVTGDGVEETEVLPEAAPPEGEDA
jgi:hypothetical protein